MEQEQPRPTIVLVEDEPEILVILQSILRRLVTGYDIVTAHNVEDALTVVTDPPCRVVITDYQLGDTHGIDLVVQLKKRYPHIRTILLTAYPSPDVERTAHDVGVDYYLMKPFSLDQFERIIRELLE